MNKHKQKSRTISSNRSGLFSDEAMLKDYLEFTYASSRDTIEDIDYSLAKTLSNPRSRGNYCDY